MVTEKNLTVILDSVNEIGIINVLVVLFVLYQFKMLSWLQKQNEYLLKRLFDKEVGNGNNKDNI